MITGKSCKVCKVSLVPGENWTEGLIRARSHYCKACNSEKGKKHYALNAQKYLDMQRERTQTKEGAAKKAEYGSSFYAKNKDRWVEYHATQRVKENTDPWVRAGRMIIWIRKRAAQKGLDFDLTREWIAEKLVIGRCEITGLEFDLGRGDTERFNPLCPSVDRVDPKIGYIQSNCRTVVWIYNMAKSEWSDDVVLRFANALVAHKS